MYTNDSNLLLAILVTEIVSSNQLASYMMLNIEF